MGIEDLPPLPEGAFYKGGIARIALTGSGVVRDVDVVLVDGDIHKLQDQLEFLDVDADVEEVGSWEEYMSSRDFTVNQVAWCPRKGLKATDDARKDAAEGVIRPTEYELEGGVRARILARAALFAARLQFDIVGLDVGRRKWWAGFEVAIATKKAVSTECLPRFWQHIRHFFRVPEFYLTGAIKVWDEEGPNDPWSEDKRVMGNLRKDAEWFRWEEEFRHLDW